MAQLKLKRDVVEDEKYMKTYLLRVSSMAVTMVLVFVLGTVFAQAKVDLNKADVEQLMSLKGIGEQKAKAIVKYRQMNGPFQSLDDFLNVPGIGEKTVANNMDMIIVSPGMPGVQGNAEKASQGTAEKTNKAMPAKK